MAALAFQKMGIKDVFSWTSLFNGYFVCNNLSYAHQMFDAMAERNKTSWTDMITRCVKRVAPIQASELFKQMGADGETRPCANSIEANGNALWMC